MSAKVFERPSVQVSESGGENVADKDKGTVNDVEDMKRLGKSQVLRRNFNTFTIFGFVMSILNTWQAILSVAVFGLANGGTAGLLYMYVVVAVLFLIVNISMAEMASMAPTSGGQYHWISEFAPRSKQKVLSYMIGWLCVLGWQCGVASGCYLAATQIQGLIALNNPDYVFHRWHGTLLIMAVVCWISMFNTLLVKYLPLVQYFTLALYLGGFVIIITILWVLGKRDSATSQIWTQFSNEGGWSSIGAATLVGIITPVTAILGADAAVHLSEEVRDASKTVPRVMMYTTALNGILGFVALISFVYNIENVQQALGSPTGFPFMQVFLDVTGSNAGATCMTLLITFSQVANAMTNMATGSRQLWSFARDKGFPFHATFAKVSPTFKVPLNAVYFTVTFTVLASLVNIGSTAAFNQVLSLGLGAILSSYFLSISCVAVRRIRRQSLLPRKFNLGRSGILFNLTAMCFLAVAFVLSFFPSTVNPPVTGANWSALAYVSVLAIGVVYYTVWARHQYVGPVEYIAREARAGEKVANEASCDVKP